MTRAARYRRIDTEYHELCARGIYIKEPCVQEAASLLVLVHAGKEIDVEAQEHMQERLAAFADTYKIGPDLLQSLLETIEPTLSQPSEKDLF